MTDIRLAIETIGQGPPVVLTHGLGDRASTWNAICPELATRHTVVQWDLRGHGRSSKPPDRDAYSAEVAVADLIRVIRTSDAPATLIGHSLGGFLSLVVALRHPELVASVAIISSGPGYRNPSARTSWNRHVADVARHMPIAPGAQRLCYQTDSFVIDNLASLSRPLTQIIGERDRRFHAGMRHIRDVLPGTMTHVIAGAGHHPQRSHPHDVVDALQQVSCER